MDLSKSHQGEEEVYENRRVQWSIFFSDYESESESQIVISNRGDLKCVIEDMCQGVITYMPNLKPIKYFIEKFTNIRTYILKELAHKIMETSQCSHWHKKLKRKKQKWFPILTDEDIEQYIKMVNMQIEHLMNSSLWEFLHGTALRDLLLEKEKLKCAVHKDDTKWTHIVSELSKQWEQLVSAFPEELLIAYSLVQLIRIKEICLPRN